MTPRVIWTVLRRAAKDSLDDGVPMIAQALAYSLFLAIPASLLVVLGVFSLVADPSTIESLIDRARAVMPDQAADLLRDSLRRTSESTGSGIALTVIGLALAVWTTTSAATTLMNGITVTYDRKDGRKFVRKRLVALAIVIALVVGAALVVGLLVLGPHLERWIGDAVGLPTLTAWLWWGAQWPSPHRRPALRIWSSPVSRPRCGAAGLEVDHPRRGNDPGHLARRVRWARVL